jgi:hypothetical protein
MSIVKVGDRIKSSVCTTEVIVIAAPKVNLDITCGGEPMVTATEQVVAGQINPQYSAKTLIGKRYVGEDSELELLCVKPGEGSLALNGKVMRLKEAKPLPSSD